jgi:hypothetical protein
MSWRHEGARALGHLYFEEKPGRDQFTHQGRARRIAANIAKPELLQQYLSETSAHLQPAKRAHKRTNEPAISAERRQPFLQNGIRRRERGLVRQLRAAKPAHLTHAKSVLLAARSLCEGEKVERLRGGNV